MTMSPPRTAILLTALLALSACASPSRLDVEAETEAERRQRVYTELVDRGATPAEARAALAAEFDGVPLSAQAERDARADSLRSLPPDDLTEADARWLMVYLADKDVAVRETQAEAGKRTATAATLWIVLAVGGLAAGIVGAMLSLAE